jgi:hypothetical protein
MTPGSEFAITKRIKINANLAVDLTIGPSGAVAEWVGSQPRFLTAVEKARYRAGRDELVREFARKIGGNILVVEV